MKIFPEEQAVVVDLVEEWYAAIKAFTSKCNEVFTEKAKRYDRQTPSWHRRTWPQGYSDELGKKINRIDQLLADYDPNDPATSIRWDKIQEELEDILNYARMFGALNIMWRSRWDGKEEEQQ